MPERNEQPGETDREQDAVELHDMQRTGKQVQVMKTKVAVFGLQPGFIQISASVKRPAHKLQATLREMAADGPQGERHEHRNRR